MTAKNSKSSDQGIIPNWDVGDAALCFTPSLREPGHACDFGIYRVLSFSQDMNCFLVSATVTRKPTVVEELGHAAHGRGVQVPIDTGGILARYLRHGCLWRRRVGLNFK